MFNWGIVSIFTSLCNAYLEKAYLENPPQERCVFYLQVIGSCGLICARSLQLMDQLHEYVWQRKGTTLHTLETFDRQFPY